MRSRVLIALLAVVVAGSLAAAASSALPTRGKLEGCVYTRNNGATTTDFVKVVEKGAGHHRGLHLQRRGSECDEAVHACRERDSDRTRSVRTFGVATIVVHLANPPGSYTMQFTLSAGNDITQSPCSA